MKSKVNKSGSFDINSLITDTDHYVSLLSVKQLEQLIELLKDHYYNSDDPLVPDHIYDRIEDIYQQLTGKDLDIGASVRNKEKAVKLPFLMPSQNKAKSKTGKINKWIKKYSGPYVISHKLDGISALLVIDQGKMKMYTRGDGTSGQDISHLIADLDIRSDGHSDIRSNDHLVIRPDVQMSIRGELIMTKKVWDQYYGDDNPHVRNYIAGAIGRKKSLNKTDIQRIRFVAYQLIKPNKKPSSQMDFLKNNGFHCVPHYNVEFIDPSDNRETFLYEILRYAYQSGPYQIDGLVVTQDKIHLNLKQKDKLKNPDYSIAYKDSETDEALSTVTDVIWNPSKDLLLKPVVIIEPVKVSGALIRKVTAHNAKFVVDNGIGIGAEVRIVRSGEVIPYIVCVEHPAKKVSQPLVKFKWHTDGINYVLIGDHSAVYQRRIEHMVKALGIDGLGPGTIKKLVEMGYQHQHQILNLELIDLQQIKSLGKNADKIFKSLDHVKNSGEVTLSQMMDASNLFPPGIGSRIMTKVLEYIPDILEIESVKKELLEIPGIKDKTADKIIDGIIPFKDFLSKIPDHLIVGWNVDEEDDDSDDEIESDLLEGVRVVFTGVRDQHLEKQIIKMGGTIGGSILKNNPNQILIVKDINSNSSKVVNARNQGIPIYDCQTFIEKFIK